MLKQVGDIDLMDGCWTRHCCAGIGGLSVWPHHKLCHVIIYTVEPLYNGHIGPL